MPTKPGIGFAHGLWADSSCFSKLITPVQAEGFEVAASQHSPDSDITAMIRTLGRVSSPTLLVGHSYGGTLITAAGTDDRVAGLVYIAALAPDETETSQSQQDKFSRTDVFDHIDVMDGRIWLRPQGVPCFAGDLPESEQKLVWATQMVPDPDLFHQKAEDRLAFKAKLVHRGQQRPNRPPRTPTSRRPTHGRQNLRRRQQPRPHAVAPRLRPRRDPSRRRLDLVSLALFSP
jgi:pimeloyl-ACP methyl ester carboxylesterase